MYIKDIDVNEVLGLENNNFYKEKEIFEPLNLCESDGKLCSESVGWSRNTLYNCNLAGRWLRKKKWNYWCVNNNECLFSVTISNLDYAGMVFIYFLDFKTKKFIEKTIITPFGKGCIMPNIVHETVTFNNKDLEIELAERNNNTHILVKCKNFDGLCLEANFKVIYSEDHETLNVVIPWNKTTFQFTSKHQCLPVQGILKVGDKDYAFNANDTFACLDFGRGIWPRKASWNWANASGIAEGKKIGLNLGAKWTSGTGMTENALVIDGKLIKLSEDIIFAYDKNDYMKPWTIKTDITNRVNLNFIPFYERIANSNLLFIKSKLNQMIGYMSGEIEDINGEIIHVENLIGCAEDHYAKW